MAVPVLTPAAAVARATPQAECWAATRGPHGGGCLPPPSRKEIAQSFGLPQPINRRVSRALHRSSRRIAENDGSDGVAERFIRTLKENVLWVRSFDTIEALRLALLEFKRTYNEHWMLERYDYRSPAQVRRDLVGLDAAA